MVIPMKKLVLAIFLCSAGFISTSSLASSCDEYPLNGYCIEVYPALSAGSYPYFETPIEFAWKPKKEEFSAKYKGVALSSLFRINEVETYAVTLTQLDFSAKVNPDNIREVSGSVTIMGNIDTFDTNYGPQLLMSAQLEGVWAWTGMPDGSSIIGFNTTNIVCNESLENVFHCANDPDKVIYFHLDEELNFDQNFKSGGMALTSIPLP